MTRSADHWLVVDDWSESVPVTRAEIQVIENYLADLIDTILGGGHADE